MMPRTPSHRERIPRSLSRLVAAATLAVFVVVQPWVVCLPLCHLQGHTRVAMASSLPQDHVIHCHSDRVIQSERSMAQSLGSMLPARWVPVLPPLRVVTHRFTAPTEIHLQQVPATDPPPPRSV